MNNPKGYSQKLIWYPERLNICSKNISKNSDKFLKTIDCDNFIIVVSSDQTTVNSIPKVPLINLL